MEKSIHARVLLHIRQVGLAVALSVLHDAADHLFILPSICPVLLDYILTQNMCLNDTICHDTPQV